jgi:hypothetical protein
VNFFCAFNALFSFYINELAKARKRLHWQINNLIKVSEPSSGKTPMWKLVIEAKPNNQ